jgi:hypothetical protein
MGKRRNLNRGSRLNFSSVAGSAYKIMRLQNTYRYTDQSPNDHSPTDQSPNDQSSNDQSPNDQSPNFLKCDQSPNATNLRTTNLRTTNLRMRPILINIPDFQMSILPACCTSVYLVGNEKFRGFS